jgi:phenylalanyl-tRNA synthetase beta chain
MKVPLNWLREYVDWKMPVAELAERLTLAGLEVSGVRLLGLPAPEGLRVKSEEVGPVWARDKIFVGRVAKVAPHPDADRLRLPTVEYGQGRSITMVTGAPNLKVGDVGQKVVLALSGAVLFDGHSSPKQLKELKPGKIRGVPSEAMVCSSLELGIDEEHEGIILLEDDAPAGTPLADFMGDIVLELEITPNLARCQSLIGVAREVVALAGSQLKLPPHTPQAKGEPVAGKVKVEIEDPKLCARYAAMLLHDVKLGPAPGWMQRRLTYAGMRPINNIVDVTNYVMLEWGQPLHAFDYDVLVRRAGNKPPTIIVRPARAGEVLKTLDGQERKLTPDMLVIADTAGPIALAGVMGGAETEVSDKTANILLESANFNFFNIRRTMKALNLPSEASVRFSKGIHAELVRPAAGRAAELMRLHAGATICQGIVDNYPAPLPQKVIELPMAEVRRVLGIDIPIEECSRLLTALELKVERTGPDALRVVAPPHRTDIEEGRADLIEDLIRLHGYDKLGETALADELPPQAETPPLGLEERVRDVLVEVGLQEAITYSLTTPDKEKPLGLPTREYVTLLNPISVERSVMRQSVLAGLLDVAAANLRHTDSVRLFEVGLVYLRRADAKLPDEPRRVAVVLCGKRQPDYWQDAGKHTAETLNFLDLKGVIEALVAALHVPDATYRPAATPYLHPGKAAELLLGGRTVGAFGEMHPEVARAYDLGQRAVLAAELDLEAIGAATPGRHLAVAVPRFPAALRDVAVIVEESIAADRVEKEIRAAGGDLLAGVRLFDLYRGESIAAGHKSLAYALTYQAADRTLTDKEVDRAHKKIEDRLRHMLKAQIRGKE